MICYGASSCDYAAGSFFCFFRIPVDQNILHLRDLAAFLINTCRGQDLIDQIKDLLFIVKYDSIKKIIGFLEEMPHGDHIFMHRYNEDRNHRTPEFHAQQPWPVKKPGILLPFHGRRCE